jgi:hypothetical protein
MAAGGSWDPWMPQDDRPPVIGIEAFAINT